MSKPESAPAEKGDTPDPRLYVHAVERAFRVLEAFGREARPLSLSEIAAASGLDKSGAQRIAYTLRRLGYLSPDEGGRGLMPGLRLMDRSFDFLRMHPLVERATPVLMELCRNAQERVDLSLLDDVSTVYAVRLQSRRESFYATLVGRRLPTFVSSGGRAMMACLPDTEVESLLARSDRHALTPRTITGLKALRACVAEARACGHALAMEQALLGEIVVAAAIRDRDGRPVAAIHVAASLSDWEPEPFRRRMAPMAMEAARGVERLRLLRCGIRVDDP